MKRILQYFWPAGAFERVLRLGNLALVLFFGGLAFSSFAVARDEARDLARRKAWRTSSTLSADGCQSPAQQCRSEYFFHTEEENNPWVEIDLGRETAFSKVRVVNRRDSHGDRAVPLVIEVSRDRSEWRIVARRTEIFSSWNAEFPATHARFVRLRAARKTFLHLQRVQVLP